MPSGSIYAVEAEGESPHGVDTGARGIEGQFADWNAYAVDAEISQAENTRAVCDDGDFDVVGPVLDDLVEVAAVFVGEVEA